MNKYLNYTKQIWYPCSQMKDYEAYPPIKVARAKGVYLYDQNNHKMIDAISSWWVNLFGHSNTRLNKAINEQLKKLEHVIFAGFTHDAALNFSEKMIKAAPKGLNKIFFVDNGSSAVEAALKMAFQYSVYNKKKSPKFISLDGAYHGETVGALSVSNIGLYKKIYSPLLMKTYTSKAPRCDNCPFKLKRNSCDAECFIFMEELVQKIGKDNIAGIIVEPLVQCANYMNMYPPGYLKKLRELCTKQQILFIADEIAVGFGRTGKMFAVDHAKVTPDIMCLSKGITGGYMPFSVILTTDRIYKEFYSDYYDFKAFMHSHSYTGNPLGCALGLEVLNIFKEEDIIHGLNKKIKYMQKRFDDLKRYNWASNIRQTGFIGAFDLRDKNSKPLDQKKRLGFVIGKEAIKKGVYIRPLGDTIYFMPPLITKEKEIDMIFDVTIKTVESVI